MTLQCVHTGYKCPREKDVKCAKMPARQKWLLLIGFTTLLTYKNLTKINKIKHYLDQLIVSSWLTLWYLCINYCCSTWGSQIAWSCATTSRFDTVVKKPDVMWTGRPTCRRNVKNFCAEHTHQVLPRSEVTSAHHSYWLLSRLAEIPSYR